MKLKTKLLPVFGGLTATVAVVTPLATSCSEWVRYTDMLHEYKPGVVPYQKVMFSKDTIEYDADELYWERFEKNTDILRDDFLWTLSKVICFENTDSEYAHILNDDFKNVYTYNCDIYVDEVIKDKDDTRRVDESAVNFTINWEFEAQFKNETKPTADLEGDKTAYIDLIHVDMSYKTIDPWALWFDNAWVHDSNSPLHDEWVMSLQRPDVIIGNDVTDKGMVCIQSNIDYRYSTVDAEHDGDTWGNLKEHQEARRLAPLIDMEPSEIDLDTFSAYTLFYNYFVWPLTHYAYEQSSQDIENEKTNADCDVNCFGFCSTYLQNVDYFEQPE